MSEWERVRDAVGLQLRPIDAWSGKPTVNRERSPFSAGLKDTLATLRRELGQLKAKSVVLQIALREGHFRLDGLPRAGATATHPGVILAFDSQHGPLRIAMDRFTNWEHNLRAIAMHLEHLRLAGLYGVGRDGEQYRGWKALGAGDGKPSSPDHVQMIADAASLPLEEVIRDPKAAVRQAIRNTHPDTGGDHETFVQVQAAARKLNCEATP